MSKMLEETREQPQALAGTLEEGLGALRMLRRQLESSRPRLVVLAARGTSDNAAQFGRYLIEITTGIPVSLAAPSILTLYGSELALTDVLVVGISQSGESTDTNAVLEDAGRRGAVTV
ncbi:MAG TPA: SIS domain-containing protein, partial [Candidatus Sulfopaludibacter sp.]|nr:SIS domain-containing protein [Candidatus Sulfopaludibacter sp.]